MGTVRTRLAISLIGPGRYRVALTQCEGLLPATRTDIGDLQEIVILALRYRNLPGDPQIIEALLEQPNDYP